MTDEMEKLQKTAMICDKGLPMNKAAKSFKKTIDEFNFISIIITALNNDAMNDDLLHWEDVRNKYRSKTGKQGTFITKDPKAKKPMTVQRLITHKMGELHEDIVEISQKASLERKLREDTDTIKTWIKTQKLEFIEKTREEEVYYILGKNEEFLTDLYDHMVGASTILANRYVAKIRNQAEQVKGQLKRIEAVYNEWWECQKLWIHLEPIF